MATVSRRFDQSPCTLLTNYARKLEVQVCYTNSKMADM